MFIPTIGLGGGGGGEGQQDGDFPSLSKLNPKVLKIVETGAEYKLTLQL